MKLRSSVLNWGLPILGIALTVTLVAWAGGPQNPPSPINHSAQDTVPGKESKAKRLPGDRDLDKELRELERAKEELSKMKDQDWDKMKKDLEESIKKIDLDKIQFETEKALQQANLEKMKGELEASLSKIDFDKLGLELEKALKEIDINFKEGDFKDEMEKAKKELKRAKMELEEQRYGKEWKKDLQEELKKINTEEIRKEMDEAKKEMENAKKEMERAKADLDLEKLDFKKQMSDAREEIEKAKVELKGYQDMIYSMEKEGILDTSKDYTIEFENGQISVNGKKQPEAVNEKYGKYFKKKTTIKKEKGDFNIDLD